VQWELTEDERIHELETQATASLRWSVDVPEAILRLLLQETAIDRTFDPPEDYDPAVQGEWDAEIVTFSFNQPVKLIKVERDRNHLYLEYKIGDLGYWSIEIEPEKVTIERV
jgi:hypothetical protein